MIIIERTIEVNGGIGVAINTGLQTGAADVSHAGSRLNGFRVDVG